MELMEDTQLDLLAFATLARTREAADDETIAEMFAAFDQDKDGLISAHLYLQASLLTAMLSTVRRVVALLSAWDEHRTGTVGELFFKQAVCVLGYSVPPKVAAMLFRNLDKGGSGSLGYSNLAERLADARSRSVPASLKLRYTPGGQGADQDNRVGRPIDQESYNYEALRARALPTRSSLNEASELAALLTLNVKVVVDLLCEWDEDGSGIVDGRQFRQAVATLHYAVPRAAVDELFASLDNSKDGFLEYNVLQQALRSYKASTTVSRHRRNSGAGMIHHSHVLDWPSTQALSGTGIRDPAQLGAFVRCSSSPRQLNVPRHRSAPKLAAHDTWRWPYH